MLILKMRNQTLEKLIFKYYAQLIYVKSEYNIMPESLYISGASLVAQLVKNLPAVREI